MKKLNDTQALDLDVLENVSGGGGWYAELLDRFSAGLEAGRADGLGAHNSGYVGDVNSDPTGLA